MIFDSLPRFAEYCPVHPLLAQVGEFLASADLAALADGRHEIGTEGCHALVSGYETLAPADGFIECHRRFIDIQVLAAGEERIGICRASDCTAGAYDSAKDFQKLEGAVDFITLRPGCFAVFFPHDGHMPKCHPAGGATLVRKIVVKVPVLP